MQAYRHADIDTDTNNGTSEQAHRHTQTHTPTPTHTPRHTERLTDKSTHRFPDRQAAERQTDSHTGRRTDRLIDMKKNYNNSDQITCDCLSFLDVQRLDTEACKPQPKINRIAKQTSSCCLNTLWNQSNIFQQMNYKTKINK